jgi:hypothetical protein
MNVFLLLFRNSLEVSKAAGGVTGTFNLTTAVVDGKSCSGLGAAWPEDYGMDGGSAIHPCD